MRIGLSYHGGDDDYEEYPAALQRRARALGLSAETFWLAGAGRETRLGLLDAVDAVVLTGGADVEPHRYGFEDAGGVCTVDTERDAVEWLILERLAGRPLPMLAICRGAQILNVFRGGTLLPDLGHRNAVHRRNAGERREHGVEIAQASLLHQIVGATSALVNSSHHQAVDRLAPGFRASAVSEDGIVEAYERSATQAQPLLLAVQWHPEAMAAGEPMADAVLDALLSATLSRR